MAGWGVKGAQHVIGAGLENIQRFGKAGLELLHQVGGFRLRALLVALHENSFHPLADFGLAPLRNLRQNVAVEVNFAALPLGFQDLAPRALQPAVRIGNDELNAAESTLFQALEELRPPLIGLRRNHIETQHLAPPLRVHAGGDYNRHALDAIVLPHLLVQRVHPHIPAPAQQPLPELPHLFIQRRAELTHLARRDARDAELRQNVFDLPRAHSLYDSLLDNADQRLLAPL